MRRVAVAAIVALGVTGCAGRSGSRPAQPVDPRLARVTALAAEVSGRRPVQPGDVILARSFAGERWQYAYSSRAGLICAVILPPQTSFQARCEPPSRLRRRVIFVSELGGPLAGSGDQGVLAVYGLVAPTVRSASIHLSDCTRLDLGLRSRPVFWQFRRISVERRVFPTDIVAAVRGRGRIQIQLGGGSGISPRRCG